MIDVTVLLGDPRLPDRTKPGAAFTADDFDQVERLKAALGTLEEVRFHYWNDHERLLDDLRVAPPAFVLNLCDTGFRNEPLHELHLPALLELAGVPYSGSGPAALGLCYDKALVRAIAQDRGVPVPWEHVVRPGEDLPDIPYPAFVKPSRADGSQGITTDSIVHDRAAAERVVAALRAQLPPQPLLVQEFLSGTEFGVGCVGNPGADFEVLPVLEVDYSGLDPALPRLLEYGSKTDPTSPYWNDVGFREAQLDDVDRDAIRGWCRTLFEALGMRDYGRCDFRADAAGRIKLIEVNPNPAWCWDGKLAKMAGLAGHGHGWLMGRILAAATRRTGVGG